jgi:hypothetical protein
MSGHMSKRSNIAREADLRAKAEGMLRAEGFDVWHPPKPRFAYVNTDILGTFDILAVRGHLVYFIQLTTVSNLAARRKKVLTYLRQKDVEIDAFVWAWHEAKQSFKIEQVR